MYYFLSKLSVYIIFSF